MLGFYAASTGSQSWPTCQQAFKREFLSRAIPVTKYSSRPSIVFMSLSSILKPPMSAFCCIRSFFVLFGRGTKPCCTLHLTISCPGLQPYFFDSSTIFGCFILNALASGAYASTMMSFFSQCSVSFERVLNGCTSIWLTAGFILGLLDSNSSI